MRIFLSVEIFFYDSDMLSYLNTFLHLQNYV